MPFFAANEISIDIEVLTRHEIFGGERTPEQPSNCHEPRADQLGARRSPGHEPVVLRQMLIVFLLVPVIFCGLLVLPMWSQDELEVMRSWRFSPLPCRRVSPLPVCSVPC